MKFFTVEVSQTSFEIIPLASPLPEFLVPL